MFNSILVKNAQVNRILAVFSGRFFTLLVVTALLSAPHSWGQGSFNISITAGSTLSANPLALMAFQRAAAQWEAYITDPITINIDADMANLGPNILGEASSVLLQGSYTEIRDAMVDDAMDESDDTAARNLPTAAQFTALLATGHSLSGNLVASKANLKAMGFTGLDDFFGISDATITFSNNFAFDFDNSDGVTFRTLDFETVAAHELGHALGFISAVDQVDAGATIISPMALDLFRFPADADVTMDNFTTHARDLRSGADAIFYDLTRELAFSTGFNTGDGNQASHWKDDELSSVNIGIMDPTLSYGTVTRVGANDLRALDVIGYEINSQIDTVPEPQAWVLILMGVSSAGFILRKKGSGKTVGQ